MADIKQVAVIAANDVVQTELSGKKWYYSKTLWANVVAIIAILLQMKFGYVVSAEMQFLMLSVINLILRNITKEPIVI